MTALDKQVRKARITDLLGQLIGLARDTERARFLQKGVGVADQKLSDHLRKTMQFIEDL